MPDNTTKKSDSLKPASKVPECPYTDEKLYEAYCAGQNSLISADWESPSEVEALITTYDSYIALLVAELEELIPISSSHGWKSHRYEAGIECRKAIDNLKGKG